MRIHHGLLSFVLLLLHCALTTINGRKWFERRAFTAGNKRASPVTSSSSSIDNPGQDTDTPLTTLQVDSILSELSHPADWTPVRRGEISIWKRGHQQAGKEADHASFAVKAMKDMPVPQHVVSQLLLTRDYNIIRRFNPTIHGGRDLERQEHARITHVLTKPQFLLRPRDFVCLVQWNDIHPDNPTHVICNTPISHHQDAPVTHEYCRGQLRGLHVVQATSPTTCRYTCVHEIDPGGWAPRRLVNLFALRKPPVYMKQVQQVAMEQYTAIQH